MKEWNISTFTTNGECGGQTSKDAKLTAAFAKKLSVQGKGEKAEHARNYFIKVEDKLKEIAKQTKPSCIEDVLIQSLQEMKAVRHQLSQQGERIGKLDDRVEGIRDVVSLDTTSWRNDTRDLLNKISDSLGGGLAFQQVRVESYDLLDERMGVSLKTRLTNKRRRMAEDGVCKSKRDKTTYVDIIAEDKKLIEGYVAIVKEMAIKYGAV